MLQYRAKAQHIAMGQGRGGCRRYPECVFCRPGRLVTTAEALGEGIERYAIILLLQQSQQSRDLLAS
jgi:hypothetical protein